MDYAFLPPTVTSARIDAARGTPSVGGHNRAVGHRSMVDHALEQTFRYRCHPTRRPRGLLAYPRDLGSTPRTLVFGIGCASTSPVPVTG